MPLSSSHMNGVEGEVMGSRLIMCNLPNKKIPILWLKIYDNDRYLICNCINVMYICKCVDWYVYLEV